MQHQRAETIRKQLAEIDKIQESCDRLRELGFKVSSILLKRLEAHRAYLKTELAYYESQLTMFGGG